MLGNMFKGTPAQILIRVPRLQIRLPKEAQLRLAPEQ